MEKKIYSRPIAAEVSFTPNHYVASCEMVINKEYVVDPNGLLEGIHVKFDYREYGIFDSPDLDGPTFKSNHLSGNPSLYYIGTGWGVRTSGNNINWPRNTPLTETEMIALGFEKFYLFSNQQGEPTTSSGGIKVYGGSEIEKIVKDFS